MFQENKKNPDWEVTKIGKDGEKVRKQKKPENLIDRLDCKSPMIFFLGLLIVSEAGDKSQLTTFVLAVNYQYWSILAGGCLAHCFTTGVALLSGDLICSEIVTNLLEGVVYLTIAIWEILFGIVWNPAL